MRRMQKTASSYPPKPRLTLRVGITGHRPNKLTSAVIARVQQQLPEIFAAIERAAASIRAQSSSIYADDPALFRMISGFAEGVDQIAVAASPTGWRIEAILPFPRWEYLKDFATSAAGDGRDVRDEFLKSLAKASVVTEIDDVPSDIRHEGYARAGSFMLRQIDVLVAVWDGKPPKPAGTGSIARGAVEAGIPVIWLSTVDEGPARLIMQLATGSEPKVIASECTDATLLTALAPAFAAPALLTATSAARTGLDRYFGERWKRRAWFTAYDALRRVARGRLPRPVLSLPSFEQHCHDWDSFLATAPAAANLRERLGHVLAPRHAWADTLAVHYSHLYRSAYVFCYFLSAAAVFIALGTVFLHDDPQTPARDLLSAKAVFVGSELIVIGAIILIIRLGLYRHWHERWLNYRALAEMLRHGRFLAFVSEFGRLPASRAGARDAPWMLWYVRATMREIGLPGATLDGAYRHALLDATYKEEIAGPQGQLEYNLDNIKVAREIDHFLHRLGMGCFVLTSVILALFLALFGLDRLIASASIAALLLVATPLVTFLSAGLPALGAAVAGIRVHSDFEASVRRSARTLNQLAELSDDYASAAKDNADLDDTADLLIETARVLSEDIAAWQDLYGRKRLTLPA